MKKVLMWTFLCLFLCTSIAAAGPLERFFKAKDAGQLIDLDESDVAVIELESNPSTGYCWQYPEDAGRLRIIKREFVPDNPGMIGTSGTEKIYVVAKKRGRANIRFDYKRSFGTKATLQSHQFRFKAKRKFLESLLSSYQTEDLSQTAPVSKTATLSATAADGTSGTVSATLTASASQSYYNYCSENGGCPTVRNQGSCGSCWAFATVGPLEAQILAKDGVEVDLSEQYLMSCNNEGYGCNGGWWAHEYHVDTYVGGENEAGAVYESLKPYKEADTSCNPPHAKAYRGSSYGYVNSTNTSALKQAMIEHGPLTVSVCSDWRWNYYTGGVFSGSWTCWQANHGVVLVGWDDSNSAWIMRNSWGPDWGENGYMRIAYGANGIGADAAWIDYAGGGTIPGDDDDDDDDGGDNAIVNGTYSMIAQHSGKAVDTWAWGTTDGTNIAQYSYWGGNAQKFNISSVDGIWHRITPYIASDQAVDVSGCVTDAGANIQTWTYWGGACQQFRFEEAGSGVYRIIARNSGMCLDVLDFSEDDGANIIQYNCTSGSQNQMFQLIQQ